MSDRVNPPKPQPGPIAFIGVCIVRAGLALRGMLTLPTGAGPWWTGLLGLLLEASCFAFIIGGWLRIQRELVFGPEAILVRRWLEIAFGRPGTTIPIDAQTRAAIILQNIRSLRLEHPGVAPVTMTLGYWDLRAIRHLVEVIHQRGIPLEQYWEGPYPPGTA